MNEQKEAKFSLNKEKEGNIEAVFSVFNMIDSDGDVVVKGAVKSGFPKSGNVPMVWSHDWKQPIGKGTIEQDDDKAVFKGQFFMDTDAGVEAYKLVKNMGDLQQWSFGYEVNDYESGEFKDKQGENQNVRYLKDLSVFEVSPVLVGANRETYTLAMKHAVQQESGEIKDEIKMEDLEAVLEEGGAGAPAEISEEGSIETVSEKGHTPVHTVEQAVGQIAEDLKDIMKSLPKDENAPLPSWWVDGMKMVANKTNKYRDLLVNPKLNEMDKPMETDGWNDEEDKYSMDDEKSLKDDNQIEDTVVSRTFSEHIDSLIEDVNAFKSRVMSLALLRAEKGKRLGKSASDGVASVANVLEDTFRDLDDLLNEGDLPIVEAEVEVVEEEVIEIIEDEVIAEAMPDVSNEVEIVEGDNVEELIEDTSANEAMNRLFLDTQSALARTLGVEINNSDNNIDGDIEEDE